LIIYKLFMCDNGKLINVVITCYMPVYQYIYAKRKQYEEKFVNGKPCKLYNIFYKAYRV
jgi:uncharacterized membrane protein